MSLYKVKIVAPYDPNNNRYIQIRNFLSWKDSIAKTVTEYGVRCYYKEDGIIVEATNQHNYDRLLSLNNAHPY